MRAPELLREWRKAAGISQSEAADRLEVRQPTWSDYEGGRKVPRTILAVKIATLTGGAVPVESWGPETGEADTEESSSGTGGAAA